MISKLTAILTFITITFNSFCLQYPYIDFKKIPQDPQKFLNFTKNLISKKSKLLGTSYFLKHYNAHATLLLSSKKQEIKKINQKIISIGQNPDLNGFVKHLEAYALITENKNHSALKLIENELSNFNSSKKTLNQDIKLLLTTLKAGCYYNLHDFHNSTLTFLDVLKNQKIKPEYQAIIYMNIGSNFYASRLQKKALQFYLKADKLFNHKNIDVLNYLSWIYLDLKNTIKAKHYANLLFSRFTEFDNFQKSNLLETLSKIDLFEKDYENALLNIDYSIRYLENIKFVNGRSENETDYYLIAKLEMKGDALKGLGKLKEAERCYQQALKIAQKQKRSTSEKELSYSLYLLNKQAKKYTVALCYLEDYQKIEKKETDLRLNDELLKLEKKFNFEKQKKSIEILLRDKKIKQNDIEKSNNYIITLTVITILGIISTLVLLKYFFLIKSKNRLTIEFLESKYALEKTLAVLNGQELEKQRISMDLHDGIANDILTIIYSNSDDCKEKLMIVYNQVRELSHNLSTMKTTSNIKPREILLELYYRIFENENINIKLNWDNLNNPLLTAETNLIFYRVVQELFLNIKKHSNASLIKVICQTSSSHIFVKIYDNGTVDSLEQISLSGIGLDNIESRILSIGGEFEIVWNSIEDEIMWGTKATFHLPISILK